MKIAFLDSFYGGSHKNFLDGLIKYSKHEIKPFVLPARFWKWRMRSSAMYFADQFSKEFRKFDLVVSTDMMNLAEFKALSGYSGPTIHFLHENQLTYPLPGHDTYELHFGFINMASAMAADLNLFNSNFQYREFFQELPNLINRIPEFFPIDAAEKIRNKSRVIYMGCDFTHFKNAKSPKNKTPIILWSHRWEFDKQPHVFFKALYTLAEQGVDFKLIILGENFQIHPKEFLEARERLSDRIIRYGFVESKEDYAHYLNLADISLSTAKQENFGFAIAEAMYCKTIPLLPNRLSYPELLEPRFHDRFLYNDDIELVTKLRELLNDYRSYDDVRRELSDSIARFTWENRIDDFDKTFEEVAAK